MDETIPIRRSRRVAGLGADEGKDKDVTNESGDEIDSDEELDVSQQTNCKKIIVSPIRDAKEKERAGKKKHDLLRDFQIGEETEDE